MPSSDSFRALFHNRRILWQTRTASYCLGLDEWAPLGIVLCLDDGCDLDLLEASLGIRFLAEERAGEHRRAYGDEPETYSVPPRHQAELLQALAAAPAGSWLAASPYPASAMAELMERRGIRCVVRDWNEFQRFSSKSTLRQCLEELDAPRLQARRLRLSSCSYSHLADEFGATFVVQRDRAAAGIGTRVITCADECARAAAWSADEAVWVAPYAGSLSLNINAVATEAGTVVGYPSVQIVGQPALGGPPSGHCGNDFTAAAALDRSLLNSTREQTARIGGWLAAHGYRGLFGLDYVVDNHHGLPCAVDLNPRWQGSTSLQAQAESRQGRLPLAAAELAYRLGLLDPRELVAAADRFFDPLEGSQIFLRAPSPGWWIARNGHPAGVCRPDLSAWRPGLRLGELHSPEEVVITGGLPRPGRLLQGGVTLARLCALRAAVDPNSGLLLPWAQQTASLLYDRLDLQPADRLAAK